LIELAIICEVAKQNNTVSYDGIDEKLELEKWIINASFLEKTVISIGDGLIH
jgi:hypothetical protein